MPASLLKRINLDYLYPPFRDRLLEVIAKCSERGADYYAVQGLRSYQEQDQLFRIGRDIPGNKVTNAKGGQSQHQFGLAVDFVRDSDLQTPGLQPDWGDSAYDTLIEELGKAGLHSGVGYRDRPHAGWPEYYKLPELNDLAKIWSLSTGPLPQRLQRVWEYVTAHSAPLPNYPEEVHGS